MKNISVKRAGFTMIELMLVMGIISMSTGFSIPLYRQYIIRNDLEIARQNISQGLQRARFLSQVAMNDAGWGFYSQNNGGRATLFMGASYAVRDPNYDEYYAIPETISVEGLTEVAFSKIGGMPDKTGIITLRALNGEERTIAVTVGDEGTVSIPDDWMAICVDPYTDNPRTIHVPDSLWEYYQSRGAEIGTCEQVLQGGEDMEEEQGGDVAEDETGVDEEDISITEDTVVPEVAYTCTISVLGAALTNGAGGYDMPVTMQVRLGATGWLDVFGNWLHPADANVNDGQMHIFTCPGVYTAGTTIDLSARSWQKTRWWYSGNSNSHWRTHYTRQTMAQSERFVWALRDGDTVPDVSSMAQQASIESFLRDYINAETGTVMLPDNQVIYLFELGTANLQSDAADYQDLVVLVSLHQVQ
ncbi:MAG: prepilin-type N-terminal cleavage/methylation domain-containing protein [Candidatus Peribacteraceae bacterium]